VRSSNSSDLDRGPFWFLERCLDAIEREMPAAYRRIVGALGRRAVAIAIGDDLATLSIANGSHAISREPPAECAIELSLTEATIRRVLEGRCTIVDAAIAGDLVLRGAADDLAALHDALLAFIHGAVRSPSTPRLLEAYLDRDALPNVRSRSPDAHHGERHGPPHR
jgi:hypothetical protein